MHVHLNEVSECVVDVGSFRQEKATAWTDVIEEEQILVLCKHIHRTCSQGIYDQKILNHFLI